MNGPVNVKG